MILGFIQLARFEPLTSTRVPRDREGAAKTKQKPKRWSSIRTASTASDPEILTHFWRSALQLSSAGVHDKATAIGRFAVVPQNAVSRGPAGLLPDSPAKVMFWFGGDDLSQLTDAITTRSLSGRFPTVVVYFASK